MGVKWSGTCPELFLPKCNPRITKLYGRKFGDETVKESIDFQEDDLTIEELMELDQDDTKSDEAEKSKNIKDFFAKK